MFLNHQHSSNPCSVLVVIVFLEESMMSCAHSALKVKVPKTGPENWSRKMEPRIPKTGPENWSRKMEPRISRPFC